MRYFTSDLHIGHAAIAHWRGFDDPSAHDEMVLSRLRETMTPDDELWILGDVGKANVATIRLVRQWIPSGRVHVVLGNHDERSKFASAGGIASVEHYMEVGKQATDGYKFTMSHYPMVDWNRKVQGSYMLHGHIHSMPRALRMAPEAVRDHGRGRYGYNEQCRERGERRFDVGVDANDYRPVCAEDIVAFFAGHHWVGTIEGDRQ
jgi:calcineurin-like phosphoesterase family protein